MFRELLESNGVKVSAFSSTYTHILEVNIDGDDIWVYSNLGDENDTAIEQACLQYCIENGVKKSWIDKWRNEIYGEEIKSYNYDLRNRFCGFACHFDKNHSSTMDVDGWREREKIFWDKESKLIAAIFAHDIKIIAT